MAEPGHPTRGGRAPCNGPETAMVTREYSIATWCKRFQIDLWKLRDRMKAGELTVYEKRAEGEVDITPAAMVKLKDLIAEIETALLRE